MVEELTQFGTSLKLTYMTKYLVDRVLFIE